MIKSTYPRSFADLHRAKQLCNEMENLWAAELDEGLVAEHVSVGADGRGEIQVRADWSAGEQQQLTVLLRKVVESCWSALDNLIIETVESFGAQRRIEHPERPRFFPVADSDESFVALLKQSCLDGLLEGQISIVSDCQPYRSLPTHPRAAKIREALRLLVAWENQLDAGEQVMAWVTPIEPKVRSSASAEISMTDGEGAGPIETPRVIAGFAIDGYAPGDEVAAQSGSYVDLAFGADFEPSTPEDTLNTRIGDTVEALVELLATFTVYTESLPGLKAVIQDHPAGHAGRWIGANESERGWSDQDLKTLQASETGLGQVVDTDTLTLIVSTPAGVFERRIVDATSLRASVRKGAAAETAIQEAAATWGLPDFVLTPSVERKGAGVREIGDGLIIVGTRGVIVQSKAREVDPGPAQREASWVNKQITGATKQIDGTARRLKTETAIMTNGRGRAVTVDGPNIEWAGVVVIDHPSPPAEHPMPTLVARTPTVVLLRRDWEFLFDQLRSADAVVNYLHRVGEPTEILGYEPVRYYELAAADAAAAPDPSLAVAWPGGVLRSAPTLPAEPVGDRNNLEHGLVRIILEDIATSPFEPGRVDDLQQILAGIDSLPVGHRSELGTFVLDAMKYVRDTKEKSILWKFRRFAPKTDNLHLAFGACSAHNPTTIAAFRAWTVLRHVQTGEAIGGLESLRTIAVLLTHRLDGLRPWDTTMLTIIGDPELDPDERSQYEQLWPHRKP